MGSIYCHLAELDILEGLPQKNYVPLPREDAYLRAVRVVCIQLSQGKRAKRQGQAEATDHKATTQLSPFPTGPPKRYAVCDFSFWLYASSLAFCINCAARLDVQDRPETLCISNATAWIYDLTTYTAPCFCLPQHVQKITPPARKKLGSNGYLY